MMTPDSGVFVLTQIKSCHPASRGLALLETPWDQLDILLGATQLCLPLILLIDLSSPVLYAETKNHETCRVTWKESDAAPMSGYLRGTCRSVIRLGEVDNFPLL